MFSVKPTKPTFKCYLPPVQVCIWRSLCVQLLLWSELNFLVTRCAEGKLIFTMWTSKKAKRDLAALLLTFFCVWGSSNTLTAFNIYGLVMSIEIEKTKIHCDQSVCIIERIVPFLIRNLSEAVTFCHLPWPGKVLQTKQDLFLYGHGEIFGI